MYIMSEVVSNVQAEEVFPFLELRRGVTIFGDNAVVACSLV